jgi:hypothetical protein
MTRRSRRLAGAVVFAVGAAAAGGVIAQADQAPPPTAKAAAGGIGVTPSILEHVAKKGNVGSVTISNTTKDFLVITVHVRPWLQGANGIVAADMHHTLSTYVKADTTTFNLAPGSRKPISMILRKVPSSGSLYGSIAVFGKQQHAQNKNGIIPQYQLNSSLRLDPTRKHYTLLVGNALVSNHALLVATRSTGNTVDPITGTTTINGKNSTVSQTRIVPGHTVNVRLAALTGLKAGVYSAKITLKQGTRSFTATKSFRIK